MQKYVIIWKGFKQELYIIDNQCIHYPTKGYAYLCAAN